MEENAISTEIKSKWSGWCFWVQNWFLEQKKRKPKIFKTELIQEIKWFQRIRERDKEKREWINEKGKCLIWEWNQVFGWSKENEREIKKERGPIEGKHYRMYGEQVWSSNGFLKLSANIYPNLFFEFPNLLQNLFFFFFPFPFSFYRYFFLEFSFSN